MLYCVPVCEVVGETMNKSTWSLRQIDLDKVQHKFVEFRKLDLPQNTYVYVCDLLTEKKTYMWAMWTFRMPFICCLMGYRKTISMCNSLCEAQYNNLMNFIFHFSTYKLRVLSYFLSRLKSVIRVKSNNTLLLRCVL